MEFKEIVCEVIGGCLVFEVWGGEDVDLEFLCVCNDLFG